MTTLAIKTEGLTKAYNGVKVLNDLNLDVAASGRPGVPNDEWRGVVDR
jgi:hypothetical protein